ncbi:hypothetical protein F1D61_30060 [Methylobacterium aquaticum]|nr:hypothetical protein F1D61_30060 [Methylobacterium aquaticum]
MSCRRQPDVDPAASFAEAPSSCRKWRRCPRERPGSANDNGGCTSAWVLGLGAALGTLIVSGLLLTLAS